ncbi:response regulator transcription factor [Nonomuraea sp. KC401]|uniref:response regulator n=1 Tax=unclassified Nonomuraea TaxID=2593643 RepID=UPI0010FD9145|nr:MULTISPECIES: response regulator transcription factor [unclassified Nonomuraea]NBE95283.1 response regulator [Nonomuraea sp. K271]TLF72381.1 response regulator transcription factor [Nonomuraea sp. KC401]
MTGIRVLICDDEQLLREALVRLVGAADDLTVVGAVGDGAAAVAAVADHRPDVVLMDIRLPGMNGIEATRRIVEHNAGGPTRVLILTTFDLDSYVYAGLQAGASGFLLKDAPGERIRDGIRIVAAGQSVLAPEATTRMIEALQPLLPTNEDRALLAAADRLTERENQVCELIAQGMSNNEIAHQLFISHYTVKVHVSSILTKLDLPDRVHVLISWSRLRGLRPS